MNLEKYLISENATILEAIDKINKNGDRFILIINNKSQVVGLATDGDIRRTIESYDYTTAVYAPVSMSNISGSFYTGSSGAGGSVVTATAPVLNRTRFVKGTGVCSSYSQFRATGDASAPNFITGEAR